MLTKRSLSPHGIVPLHHVVCGGHLSNIKNCDHSLLFDTVQAVVKDLVRRGYRCPRCKQQLSDPQGIVPLWNPSDEGVFPITRPDESGLIGFGPEFADPALSVPAKV